MVEIMDQERATNSSVILHSAMNDRFVMVDLGTATKQTSTGGCYPPEESLLEPQLPYFVSSRGEFFRSRSIRAR